MEALEQFVVALDLFGSRPRVFVALPEGLLSADRAPFGLHFGRSLLLVAADFVENRADDGRRRRRRLQRRRQLAIGHLLEARIELFGAPGTAARAQRPAGRFVAIRRQFAEAVRLHSGAVGRWRLGVLLFRNAGRLFRDGRRRLRRLVVDQSHFDARDVLVRPETDQRQARPRPVPARRVPRFERAIWRAALLLRHLIPSVIRRNSGRSQRGKFNNVRMFSRCIFLFLLVRLLVNRPVRLSSNLDNWLSRVSGVGSR